MNRLTDQLADRKFEGREEEVNGEDEVDTHEVDIGHIGSVSSSDGREEVCIDRFGRLRNSLGDGRAVEGVYVDAA